MKFNDQHIPDSPFKVYVSPATGDSRKLTIQNIQDQNLQVSKCTVVIIKGDKSSHELI